MRLDGTPAAWAVGRNADVLMRVTESIPAEWEEFDY